MNVWVLNTYDWYYGMLQKVYNFYGRLIQVNLFWESWIDVENTIIFVMNNDSGSSQCNGCRSAETM